MPDPQTVKAVTACVTSANVQGVKTTTGTDSENVYLAILNWRWTNREELQGNSGLLHAGKPLRTQGGIGCSTS